jgi:hypothetical protein
MQKDDFFQACIKDPDFIKNNCFMAPLESIDITDHQEANEVRVILNTRPVLNKQLRDYIEEENMFQGHLRPNIVPVTLSGPTANRQQDDGYNRHTEILEIAKDNPKVTHIFAIQAEYENKEGRPAKSQRTWSMLNDNFGLDEAPATDADIVNSAVVDIKYNLRFGSSYEDTPLERIIDLIQGELKHPLHGTKAKNLAAKVLEQLPEGQKKLKNYADKAKAVETFCELNEWGLKPEYPGDMCQDKDGQDWIVYFAGTKTWINQNLVHGFWNSRLKYRENPPKILVVGFNEKIWSAKGSLAEFRTTQLTDIEKHNAHPLLGGKEMIVNRYAALGQVVKGKDKEDMSVLHNVTNF